MVDVPREVKEQLVEGMVKDRVRRSSADYRKLQDGFESDNVLGSAATDKRKDNSVKTFAYIFGKFPAMKLTGTSP